jgi:hypothetical protein
VSTLAAISTFVRPCAAYSTILARPLHRPERRRQPPRDRLKFIALLLGQLDHIRAAAGHANKFAARDITLPRIPRRTYDGDH